MSIFILEHKQGRGTWERGGEEERGGGERPAGGEPGRGGGWDTRVGGRWLLHREPGGDLDLTTASTRSEDQERGWDLG